MRIGAVTVSHGVEYISTWNQALYEHTNEHDKWIYKNVTSYSVTPYLIRFRGQPLPKTNGKSRQKIKSGRGLRLYSSSNLFLLLALFSDKSPSREDNGSVSYSLLFPSSISCLGTGASSFRLFQTKFQITYTAHCTEKIITFIIILLSPAHSQFQSTLRTIRKIMLKTESKAKIAEKTM